MNKPKIARTSVNGWLNVQLSEGPNGKLREMASKTRLSLTAIVENGIEREWEEWQKTGWRTTLNRGSL